MTPTEDRARHAIRRICGDRPDDDVVMIEVGVLLVALKALERIPASESRNLLNAQTTERNAKRYDQALALAKAAQSLLDETYDVERNDETIAAVEATRQAIADLRKVL